MGGRERWFVSRIARCWRRGVFCGMSPARFSTSMNKRKIKMTTTYILPVQHGDAGEAGRVLVEDVHDAIADLVELIRTYQSKNKLSQVMMSTLFRRRQEEAEAVVERAVSRLQVRTTVCAMCGGFTQHFTIYFCLHDAYMLLR